MRKVMEIRIKRYRTEARTGIFEVLERWASQEGRSAGEALERVLDGRDLERWQEYLWDQRNPGKATT